MPIREWARTHVRFHRSGASTDRAQRRQRRVHRGHIRSACAVVVLLAARASAALPPNAPVSARTKLIFATERRCRWDHRGFCASPRCSDTHGTLLMDRNRSCAPAAPADPGFGNRALKRVEADPGAGVADAAGDVDAYCAAQQRLGPRVRDDAGIACRLIEAVRAAEAYAIIQRAEPNRANAAPAAMVMPPGICAAVPGSPNRSAIGAGIYPMPTTSPICANSTAARSASGAGSTTIADREETSVAARGHPNRDSSYAIRARRSLPDMRYGFAVSASFRSSRVASADLRVHHVAWRGQRWSVRQRFWPVWSTG